MPLPTTPVALSSGVYSRVTQRGCQTFLTAQGWIATSSAAWTSFGIRKRHNLGFTQFERHPNCVWGSSAVISMRNIAGYGSTTPLPFSTPFSSMNPYQCGGVLVADGEG